MTPDAKCEITLFLIHAGYGNRLQTLVFAPKSVFLIQNTATSVSPIFLFPDLSIFFRRKNPCQFKPRSRDIMLTWDGEFGTN